MTQNDDNILPFPNAKPEARPEIEKAAQSAARQAARPTDLAAIAKLIEQRKLHESKRTGLKVIDKMTARVGPQEPITDGPAEDEFLRGTNTWLAALRRFFFGWLDDRRNRARTRAEVDRQMLVLHSRLKTVLDQMDGMRAAVKHGAQIIAQQQQRAEVRLQQLQANHETLRDTLNAHADEIEKLQNKVN